MFKTLKNHRKWTVARIEKLYIWKLLRTTRRTRLHYPHTCQMPLTIWTWNIPPLVIYLTQVRNRENIPGSFPPPPFSCSHTLGHTRHILLPCYACGAMLLYIYCFFPLFSPVDPETDVAPVIDYVDDDTSSFSTELPGKQTLLEHPDIAHFFLSCLH